jgi:phospholipid/cholesterol/gamma-HCH transport system ATP-binding protein
MSLRGFAAFGRYLQRGVWVMPTIAGHSLKEVWRATFAHRAAEGAQGLGVPTDAHVALRRVRMAFGARRVFEDLSCSFPRGRISVILGGSGSGKSTILRLIGGLIHPQAGEVLIDGQDVTRLSERGMRGVRRKLGMLFQGGALLDSYSVYENLALPLREQNHHTSAEIVEEVHTALQAVGVEDVDGLLPGQLSGGMLRRVALARAVIRKPTILLCDEPFSGLDPVSIKRIEALLADINRQYGMTIILVSHHVPSTMRLADHVLLLLDGRYAEGTAAELRQSADREVADFLNEGLEQPTGEGTAHG